MTISRSRLLNWLRLAFGLLLLALLFKWVPVDRLGGVLLNAHPLPLLGAFAITVLCFFLSTLKIYITLDVLDQPIALTSVWAAYYIGSFFNNFIPTSIGGDLVKTYELNKHEGTSISRNTLAVVGERLSGIVVLGTIGAIFLFWRPGWYETVGVSFAQTGREWVLYTILLIGVVLVLTYFFQDQSEDTSDETDFTNLSEWVQFPLNHPSLTAGLVAISLVFHLLRVLVFYFVGVSLGTTIPYTVILFVLPIIAFASFLPISMGGIGLREGIITFCLHAFGLPLDVSFGISLLIRVFSIVHSSIGGIVYLRRSTTLSP